MKYSLIQALILSALSCFFYSIVHAAEITGAGATFPYPIYAKWAEAYKKDAGVGLSVPDGHGGLVGQGSQQIGLVAEVGIAGMLAADCNEANDLVFRNQRCDGFCSDSPQVVQELAGSTYTLLLDDFHYVPLAIQGDVTRPDDVARLVARTVEVDAQLLQHAIGLTDDRAVERKASGDCKKQRDERGQQDPCRAHGTRPAGSVRSPLR